MEQPDFLDRAFPFPAHHEDEDVVETLLAKYFLERAAPEPVNQTQHYFRTVDLFGHDNFTIEYVNDNTRTFIIHPI